jgi:hypothetical protein
MQRLTFSGWDTPVGPVDRTAIAVGSGNWLRRISFRVSKLDPSGSGRCQNCLLIGDPSSSRRCIPPAAVQETRSQAFAQGITLRGAPFLSPVHVPAPLHARQLHLAGYLEVEDLAGKYCDGRSTWCDDRPTAGGLLTEDAFLGGHVPTIVKDELPIDGAAWQAQASPRPLRQSVQSSQTRKVWRPVNPSAGLGQLRGGPQRRTNVTDVSMTLISNISLSNE